MSVMVRVGGRVARSVDSVCIEEVGVYDEDARAERKRSDIS